MVRDPEGTRVRPAPSPAAPTLRRVGTPSSLLLVAAAGAWVLVVALGPEMPAMPGTMGLGFGGFVLVWALMMVAMMLPTVAPFAALYSRSLSRRRSARLGAFASGYLLVWVLAAVPAYPLARLAGELATTRPAGARFLAVAVLAACGLYQLTSLKERCLVRCRSPLGSLVTYAAYRGRTRDLRVGLSHGAACLGCCWALMAVLVGVGLMNPGAMVVLTGVVLAEKTWPWGIRVSRAVGVAALVLAVFVAVGP